MIRRWRWTAERLESISRHLAALLESGFPLLPSLYLLGEQQLLRKEEAENLIRRLDQGQGLAEAMEAEGFPRLFVSFVQAAEEHGDFVFGLRQCERVYRDRGKWGRDLQRALTYPLMVLILVGCAFLFLVTTVIPRFADMYASMGLELPLYTQMFLSLYGGLQWAFLFGGGMLFSFILMFLIYRNLPPELKDRWNTMWCRIPLVRRLLAYRYTLYFCVQTGSLLKAGVPLLRTLDMVCQWTPWHQLSSSLKRIRGRLLTGEPFHRCLEAEGYRFLPALSRLVALGEETGRVDESLLTMAKTAEISIRDRVDRWTKSLEPALIFFIGILMAATAIAMFLPMLNLVRAL
jgi:type II secretory pathway component PulF